MTTFFRSIDKQTAKSISAANMNAEIVSMSASVVGTAANLSFDLSRLWGSFDCGAYSAQLHCRHELHLRSEHVPPATMISCLFSSTFRWILVGSVRVPRAPRALVSIP